MIRTETIVYGDYSAPAGTVVHAIAYTVAGPQSITTTLAPGAQPEPVDLAPGDYIVTAQAVDANGSPIGPAATDRFSIPAPNVTVVIPVSISGI